MACQVEVNPVMDGFYHQASWSQPLSPEMGSPVYAQSPVGSCCSPCSGAQSPLSHMNSPVCSPPAAHSPMMQAHSPIHAQVPVSVNVCIKQEFDEALRYDNCHFANLLKSCAPELTATTTLSMAPIHMGPPHPREILDGELLFVRQ